MEKTRRPPPSPPPRPEGRATVKMKIRMEIASCARLQPFVTLFVQYPRQLNSIILKHSPPLSLSSPRYNC